MKWTFFKRNNWLLRLLKNKLIDVIVTMAKNDNLWK